GLAAFCEVLRDDKALIFMGYETPLRFDTFAQIFCAGQKRLTGEDVERFRYQMGLYIAHQGLPRECPPGRDVEDALQPIAREQPFHPVATRPTRCVSEASCERPDTRASRSCGSVNAAPSGHEGRRESQVGQVSQVTRSRHHEFSGEFADSVTWLRASNRG